MLETNQDKELKKRRTQSPKERRNHPLPKHYIVEQGREPQSSTEDLNRHKGQQEKNDDATDDDQGEDQELVVDCEAEEKQLQRWLRFGIAKVARRCYASDSDDDDDDEQAAIG